VEGIKDVLFKVRVDSVLARERAVGDELSSPKHLFFLKLHIVFTVFYFVEMNCVISVFIKCVLGYWCQWNKSTRFL